MPEIRPRRTPRPSRRRALAGALGLLALAAAAAPPTAAQPPRLAPKTGEQSFSFPEPTPVDEIYRRIGAAFEIDVRFDPNLKIQALTLETGEVDALTALDRVATAAGHFYKPLDERTILVAADTPQNRRTYEEMVIRTFQLTEADPLDVMTLLRSIVGVRHAAVDTGRHTLTVRDVADKIALTEDLVAIADRRPGEAEVAVELFEVDRAALESWLAARPPEAGSSHRLAPGGLAGLERGTAATALVRPRLGLIGDRPAVFHLRGVPAGSGEPGGGPGAPADSGDPYRTFEIEVSGRIHPAAGGRAEITLQVKVATREIHPARPGVAGDQDRSLVAGEHSSTVRLADGETFLITGLGSAGGAGEGAELRAPVGRPDRALVVALTPRVVSAPEPIPAELAELWVGTEADVRYDTAERSGEP